MSDIPTKEKLAQMTSRQVWEEAKKLGADEAYRQGAVYVGQPPDPWMQWLKSHSPFTETIIYLRLQEGISLEDREVRERADLRPNVIGVISFRYDHAKRWGLEGEEE